MLIGGISKVVRASTNGATLQLLTSCIAASEEFEVNKQTFFATKNRLTDFDICSFQYRKMKHRSCFSRNRKLVITVLSSTYRIPKMYGQLQRHTYSQSLELHISKSVRQLLSPKRVCIFTSNFSLPAMQFVSNRNVAPLVGALTSFEIQPISIHYYLLRYIFAFSNINTTTFSFILFQR